jgi:hypothetical protein
LFVELEAGGDVHFAEAAHIIAASAGGPRGDATVQDHERAAWSNLILLCANCHKIIDKAPDDFPVEDLRQWKNLRLTTLETAIGVASFTSRDKARSAIEPRLIQNRVIHEQYGPENDYRFDPESEMARMWRRGLLGTIIPNHRAILRVLDCNRDILTPSERIVVEQYRTHIQDLEDRHVHGVEGIVSRRYPTGMDDIFA